MMFDPLAGLADLPPTREQLLWESLEHGLALAAGSGFDEPLPERPLAVNAKPDIPLAEYFKRAWPIVEPRRPLLWNWHLDAMCEQLEAVSRGEETNLVINVPPGMTKSMTVCVMWPTWEWTWMPESRWIFYSYNEKFATRDAVRSRRLIASEWYQRHWGHVFRLTSDQNEKKRYENNKTGFRMVSGMGGSVTGERGDRVVIDDPIKASEGRNDNALDEVNQIFDEAISTRLNDPGKSAIVLIMQRVSARDLAGHVLQLGGWKHLSFPMEYEPIPEDPDAVPPELRNWSSPEFQHYDPRTKPGELLDPKRYDRATVEQAKKTLGSFGAAAQFQQRPVPAGGGSFKLEWFNFWEPQEKSYGPVRLLAADGTVITKMPRKLPRTFTGMLQSHDLTFTGSTSFAVSDVYAWLGTEFVYLLDEMRTNGEFTEQVKQINTITRKWPMAALKLVEAKANGAAAISTLRHTIPGLVGVPVTEGSKTQRYDAVAPFVEAGHVLLPHPDMPGFGWVRDWLVEVTSAPHGTHDDRADTLFMALERIYIQRQRVNNAPMGSHSTQSYGM